MWLKEARGVDHDPNFSRGPFLASKLRVEVKGLQRMKKNRHSKEEQPICSSLNGEEEHTKDQIGRSCSRRLSFPMASADASNNHVKNGQINIQSCNGTTLNSCGAMNLNPELLV